MKRAVPSIIKEELKEQLTDSHPRNRDKKTKSTITNTTDAAKQTIAEQYK